MRTEFTTRQLANPAIAEANDIFRKCVHCGFCNATCPTFHLLGDELDGPRGRIYLMKNLLENELTPSAKVVKHIDRCLTCLSCMTTCPSGVNYMHLMDSVRDHLDKTYHRPLPDRLFRNLLAFTLPSPGRLRGVLFLSQLLRPVKQLLPRRIRAGLNLKARPCQAHIKQHVREKDETGKTVGLIAGCVQQVIGENINSATRQILEQQGHQVHLLSEPTCCGAIEHHLGKTRQAQRRFRENMRSWIKQIDELDLDALIVNASGCGTMLKDYHHIFSRDGSLKENADRISNMVQDVTEFLYQEKRGISDKQIKNIKVAYQSPCSMQHGQKVEEQPIALLRQSGFDVQELPEKYMCCGSAGTYNLLQPDIADALGERKAHHIKALNVDVVASGNLGCMLQLQQFTDTPVVHTIELLNWASGGNKPF